MNVVKYVDPAARFCLDCISKPRTPPGGYCQKCGSGTGAQEVKLCKGCAILAHCCQRCLRQFTRAERLASSLGNPHAKPRGRQYF